MIVLIIMTQENGSADIKGNDVGKNGCRDIEMWRVG